MDNSIEFDIEKAKTLLSSLELKINEICTINNKLVSSIKQLELEAHDVKNTAIDEDYKDYAILFGETGLKAILDNIQTYYNRLQDTIEAWEQTLRY